MGFSLTSEHAIANVRRFGATGNGTTSDSTAVQAAVDWLSATSARGIVFFPPGIYLLTQSINLGWANNVGGRQASIIFKGVGDASRVTGNINDFLFKREVEFATDTSNGQIVFEYLSMTNGNSGTSAGSVKIIGNRGGVMVNSCRLGGSGHGVIFTDGLDINSLPLQTTGAIVMNCSIAGSGKLGIGPSVHTGISFGDGGVWLGNDVGSLEYGCKTIGNVVMSGGRIEVCDTAIATNLDFENNSPGAKGLCLLSVSFESNNILLDLSNGGDNVVVSGCAFTALDGGGTNCVVFPDDDTSTRFTMLDGQTNGGWDGYTIVCPGDGSKSLQRTFMSTFSNNNGVDCTATISAASPGVITLVRLNTHVLTGHLTGFVADEPVKFASTGTLPAEITSGVTYYVKTPLTADTFTISATVGGAAINTSSIGTGTHEIDRNGLGLVWDMPTGAAVAKWIQTNQPDPVFLFANLPAGGAAIRNIGDEYMISDSSTATFGATIAGSGANLVKARWDGTNWVVC